MTTTLELQHFYRGKLIEDQTIKSDFIVTACSSGLTLEKAELLFDLVYPGSHNGVNIDDLRTGFALGIDRTGSSVFSTVHPSPIHDRGYLFPVYHGFAVPQSMFALHPELLQSLINFEIASEPWPVFGQRTPSLDIIQITHSADANLERDEKTLNILRDLSATTISQLLSAILSNQSIAITGAPPDPAIRMQFVRAVMLLFPPAYRHIVTFSTAVLDSGRCELKLKFLLNNTAKTREGETKWIWREKTFNHAPPLSTHYYAQWVESIWKQNTRDILRTIHRLSEPGRQLLTHYPNFAIEMHANILGAHQIALAEQINNIDLMDFNLRNNPFLSDQMRQNIAIALARKIMQGAPIQYADILLEQGHIGRILPEFLEIFATSPEQSLRILLHWIRSGFHLDPAFSKHISELYMNMDIIGWLAQDQDLMISFMVLLLSGGYQHTLDNVLKDLLSYHGSDKAALRKIAALLAYNLTIDQSQILLQRLAHSDINVEFRKELYINCLQRSEWQLPATVHNLASLWIQNQIHLEKPTYLKLLEHAAKEMREQLLRRALDTPLESQNYQANVDKLIDIASVYQRAAEPESAVEPTRLILYRLRTVNTLLNQLTAFIDDPPQSITDADYQEMIGRIKAQLITFNKEELAEFSELCLNTAQMLGRRGRFFGGKSSEKPLASHERPRNVSDTLRWLAGLVEEYADLP